MKESFNPYTKEEALDEAQKMKEKISLGEAKDYPEAEKILDLESNGENKELISLDTELFDKVDKLLKTEGPLMMSRSHPYKLILENFVEKTELYKKLSELIKESGLELRDHDVLERLSKFFEEENINDDESRAAVILGMAHENPFESVQEFPGEELDWEEFLPYLGKGSAPRNTTGQVMSHFSVDMNDYLNLGKAERVGLRSYKNVKIVSSKENELKALLKYFERHGNQEDQEELHGFFGDSINLVNELTKKHIEENERYKEKQERKNNKELQMEYLTKGIDISPITKTIIEENMYPYNGDIKVVDKDTVVVWEERHSHSGDSGVAKYSDVIVYRNGHKQVKSFQFRDAHNPDSDNRNNMVRGVDDIEIKKNKENIEISLVAQGPGKVVFTFEQSDNNTEDTIEKLSSEEQVKFKEIFDSKVQELIEKYNKLWESTSIVQTPKGEARYAKPRIVSSELASEIGVGVVQIERQTDNRGYADPQFMNHLFVIDKEGAVSNVDSNHGYKSEQKGLMSIIGINKVDGQIDYSVDGEVKGYKI